MIEFEEFLKRHESIINNELSKVISDSSVIDADDLRQAAYMYMMRVHEVHGHKSRNELAKIVRSSVCRAMREEANKFYGPFRLPGKVKVKVKKISKFKRNRVSRERIRSELNLTDSQFEAFERIEGVRQERLSL